MERNADASSDAIQSNQILRYEVALQRVQEISSNQLSKVNRPYLNSRRVIPARWKMEVSSLDEKRKIKEDLRARRLDIVSQVYQKQLQKKKNKGSQCQVCCVYYERKDLDEFGQCGHKYCKTCLGLHINNSINNFKIVTCLDENCLSSLDITSSHIRALSLPTQQKYYKIRVFFNLSKDQDIKICPSQKCEGFIKMSDEDQRCPICGISFCKLCMLPRHNGNCDQNGVLYMQNNFLFRQCSKCRMVLEKNQGCNHMTCKCGHQFCYLCGEKWSNHHICKPKVSTKQRLPPLIFPQQSVSVIMRRDSNRNGHQHEQAVNDRQPEGVIQPQTQNKCYIFLKSFLKIIIVVFMHIISGQLSIPIIMCSIVPIFLTLIFVFFCFGAGMVEMIEHQSCLKITLLNIFLYLYYVASYFCREFPRNSYMDCYCRQMLQVKLLFPVSYIFYNIILEQCLS